MHGGIRTRLAFAPVVALAAALLAGPAVAATRLSALESGLLAQINEVRRAHGLAPLALSSSLTAAARQHSSEMGRDGYFAHESFDHSAFWKRVQRYYAARGWHSWSVGENLLWSAPTVGPGQALTMWMNSPEHRANLLNPSWRQVGLGCVHFAAAPGAYGGRPVTILTADFGARR